MDRHGKAFWPGVESLQACTYTISHGISPGIAVLTINPQDASKIALTGDLVLDDNVNRIVIPRCKVDAIKARKDGAGEVWDVVILDRRWRWRELGAISGTYNTLDPNGKPIQWTVRTPRQLAELCLLALGEQRYTINLPAVAVNPPVQWEHVPPAQALASLADSLGCRVIYRLDTDSVLLTQPGDGQALPPGSIQSDGPTLDSPERPDRIVIVGQPIRYQARFKLEAVGEDWNGEIKPIAELSYAPDVPAVAVAHTVTLTPATVTVGNTFSVELTDANESTTFTFTATAATVANVTAGLAAAINAGGAAGMPWTATDNTTTLTVTGDVTGLPFSTHTSAAVGAGSGTPTLKWVLTTLGREITDSPWSYCSPPHFSSVKATERLTYLQAVELAKRCVFRMYRITAEASGFGERGPLRVPEYEGPIVRRQQIVLQQTRAQPIEPQEPNDNLLDDQQRKRKILFYDGHTRDKPATCYGSYHHGYSSGQVNTRADSEVMIDFSVDTERQLLVFGQYVLYLDNGKNTTAPIVLETGCNVRDAVTNAIATVEGFADFPLPHFGTPPLYIHRDDVQTTILGIYNDDHKLIASLTDYPEAKAKVAYYLDSYARQFRDNVAQDRVYNGLELIWLDGAIAQVTWSIGERGAETQASRNTEHSKYIQPYFVRRKNEAMDAIVKGKNGAQPPNSGPLSRLYDPPPSQGGAKR